MEKHIKSSSTTNWKSYQVVASPINIQLKNLEIISYTTFKSTSILNIGDNLFVNNKLARIKAVKKDFIGLHEYTIAYYDDNLGIEEVINSADWISPTTITLANNYITEFTEGLTDSNSLEINVDGTVNKINLIPYNLLTENVEKYGGVISLANSDIINNTAIILEPHGLNFTKYKMSVTNLATNGYISVNGVTQEVESIETYNFNYYISPTGSDTNDGSRSFPFRTTKNIPNGSKVMLLNGEYREIVNVDSYKSRFNAFDFAGKTDITLIGESKAGVIFYRTKGTTRDHPVFFDGNSIKVANITVVRSNGLGTSYSGALVSYSPYSEFHNINFVITDGYSMIYYNSGTWTNRNIFYACSFNNKTASANYTGYHEIIATSNLDTTLTDVKIIFKEQLTNSLTLNINRGETLTRLDIETHYNDPIYTVIEDTDNIIEIKNTDLPFTLTQQDNQSNFQKFIITAVGLSPDGKILVNGIEQVISNLIKGKATLETSLDKFDLIRAFKCNAILNEKGVTDFVFTESNKFKTTEILEIGNKILFDNINYGVITAITVINATDSEPKKYEYTFKYLSYTHTKTTTDDINFVYTNEFTDMAANEIPYSFQNNINPLKIRIFNLPSLSFSYFDTVNNIQINPIEKHYSEINITESVIEFKYDETHMSINTNNLEFETSGIKMLVVDIQKVI